MRIIREPGGVSRVNVGSAPGQWDAAWPNDRLAALVSPEWGQRQVVSGQHWSWGAPGTGGAS